MVSLALGQSQLSRPGNRRLTIILLGVVIGVLFLGLNQGNMSFDTNHLRNVFLAGKGQRALPKVYLFWPMTYEMAVRNGQMGNFCRAAQSAVVNGWEPIIYNWDMSIEGLWHQDFMTLKVFGLNRLLQSPRHMERFAEDDLLLTADAYDVWLQLPPEAMAQRFMEMGHEVVLSAEKNCFPNEWDSPACLDPPPNPLHKELFWQSPEPHQLKTEENTPTHINAGALMGTFRGMRDWYFNLTNYMEEHNMDDDQGAYNQLLGDHEVDMYLDYTSKLFWIAFADIDNAAFIGTPEPTDEVLENMDTIPWDLYPKLLHHKVLGHVPACFHLNGPAKQEANGWYPQLWWASNMERFMPIVRKRMDEGILTTVTDDERNYVVHPIREICPDLDVWKWGTEEWPETQAATYRQAQQEG